MDDTARYLRTTGRRIVREQWNRPKGHDALVSVSHAWRRHKLEQARRRRREQHEAFMALPADERRRIVRDADPFGPGAPPISFSRRPSD